MHNAKIIIIGILLLLFSSIIYAQDVQLAVDNGKYTFAKVMEIDSASKKDLYSRCLEEFASSLQPASYLIYVADKRNGVTLKDEEKGSVIIRHSFDSKALINSGGGVIYTLKVEVKDNKYRYSISNVLCAYYHPTRGLAVDNLEEYLEKKRDKLVQKTLKDINGKLSKIVTDLHSVMQSTTNADW